MRAAFQSPQARFDFLNKALLICTAVTENSLVHQQPNAFGKNEDHGNREAEDHSQDSSKCMSTFFIFSSTEVTHLRSCRHAVGLL